jgi:N utilization substance protein A
MVSTVAPSWIEPRPALSLRAALKRFVPEIRSGTVEVVAASLPSRLDARAITKIAVRTTTPGLDPVAAVVGPRGRRIQAVEAAARIPRLHLVEWAPDPAVFVAKGLAPAPVLGVHLCQGPDGLEATATIPAGQLSRALGRGGANVAAAARLCRIRHLSLVPVGEYEEAM